MIHAWPLWNARLEPGRRALAHAGAFLREHCGRPRQSLFPRSRLPKTVNAGTQVQGPDCVRIPADDLTTELNLDPKTPSSAEPRCGPARQSGLHGHPHRDVAVERRIGDVRHGFGLDDDQSQPEPETGLRRSGRDYVPLFLLTLPAGALTDVWTRAGS